LQSVFSKELPREQSFVDLIVYSDNRKSEPDHVADAAKLRPAFLSSVQRDTVGAARIGVDLEPRIGAVDWELHVTKVSFVNLRNGCVGNHDASVAGRRRRYKSGIDGPQATTHSGMPCFQQETAVDDVAREVDTIGYRAVTDIDRGRKGLASLQGPFLVRRALPDRRCVGSSGKLPSQNTV
jgi:hypothetical protein